MNKRQKKKKLKQHIKQLVTKYPWLAPHSAWNGEVVDNYDYTWTELDALPRGWVKGFGKVFVEELGEGIERAGLTNQYYVAQAKEKYGSMRWYDSGGTEETYNIIRKFEVISQHVCIFCGRLDVPMLNERWMSPECYHCFRQRTLKWHPDYSEEKIREMYQKYICDEPDENGNYLIPNSYKVRRTSQGEEQEITFDIKATVDKVRKMEVL